ncbi:hypothetical protein GCM10010238_20970 [Streptomyces griseoviridis]|jgi:hypothetical protein|uniref:Uncharacterized protein n=2 Tax=Streptomyces TaxID=1883 RepID=A0A918LDB0_STRGD|nr:hypothetical protein GCM10010238_20970 [Streptomyces niveoruber]
MGTLLPCPAERRRLTRGTVHRSQTEGSREIGDRRQISGALVRISAGSRTNVWDVNAGGDIYRYADNGASPGRRSPGA